MLLWNVYLLTGSLTYITREIHCTEVAVSNLRAFGNYNITTAMTFLNKIKWILGILIVFILIVTTNLIDRNNFSRVNNSVASIYEDRLLAKGLIFEISQLVQAKEIAAITSDSIFFLEKNKQLNDNLDNLILRFGQTKFTAREKKVFSDLKNGLETSKNAETTFIESDFKEASLLVEELSTVKENLDNLSKIQLDEGKRQVSISQEAMDIVELFTHLEIYMLILLAILIQIVILYRPKKEV